MEFQKKLTKAELKKASAAWHGGSMDGMNRFGNITKKLNSKEFEQIVTKLGSGWAPHDEK